jgi:hypothetical protein
MNCRLAYCSALAFGLALTTDASASVYSHETGAALRSLAGERQPYVRIAERPIDTPEAGPAEPPPEPPPDEALPPPVTIDGRPLPFPLDNRTPGPTEEPPVDPPDLVQAEPQTEPPDPPPDEPSQAPQPDGRAGG